MNADIGYQNGADQVRVRFGPGDTDHLPLAWAEAVLTTIRSHDPGYFGAVLAEVVTGAKPTPRRART